MMQIERRHFIASLGGIAAVKMTSHEAKAEALVALAIFRRRLFNRVLRKTSGSPSKLLNSL